MRVVRYNPPDRDAVVAFIQAEEIDSRIADDLMNDQETYPLWIAWDDVHVVGALEGDFHRWFNGHPFPVSGWHAWICHMTTARARRRRKVGARLVSTFAKACHDEHVGYIGMMLNPSGDVTSRRAFFTRCGFADVGADDGALLMGATVSAVQEQSAAILGETPPRTATTQRRPDGSAR